MTPPSGDRSPRRLASRYWWVGGLLVVAAIVVVLAPLASPDPDGLERVAEDHGFLGAARDALYSIIPDYVFPGLTGNAGTILAGLATPTEAAAIGALGATLLAAAYGKLNYAGMRRAVLATTATSSMVLLLAATSNIFGAVFARLGTANWITETLLSFALPPTVMLIMVIVLIFLLGWPFGRT